VNPLTRVFAIMGLGVLLAPQAGAKIYTIDPDHSSVILNVTHLGVGTVQGRFDKFSGTFDFDPDHLDQASIKVGIEAGSINTNQSIRDRHLRSAEFLDVKKYPEITFASTQVTKTHEDEYRIEGNLSLHGVTRPVVLIAKLGGLATDMNGRSRVGFAVSTSINRKDYGINWNQMVGSSMLVGQIIQIFLNIEGVEQAAPASK
jgi:polyisoprenoid-binding protein YceI